MNTFTTSSQHIPAVAVDGDGDFVVAWQSFSDGTGGGSGIDAQRYNSAGVPVGGEIHVNSYTSSSQSAPAVAADADGDFVVVWSSTAVADGGVRAQRFDAAGVPQGAEMSISGLGGSPAVAMDAAGNFVVAFGRSESEGGPNILARRYDADGVPIGGAFRVNTYLTSVQLAPAVAMDATGDFVVAWESYLQDGADYGVYAQRYSATGAPQGSEFRVSTATASTQRAPAVGMDLSGDFVVAWNSYGQDGSGDGVYAQRYDASGAAQGGEFRVNTFTTNAQFAPAVALDADGDFLITWSSYQDGSGPGVYAQPFSAAGATIGGELHVNTFTTNAQTNVTVAADHKGDYVIAWDSNGQEGPGGGLGVYARRYVESTDTAGPVVAGVFVNGVPVRPYATHDPSVQQIVVSFSERLSVAGGTSGPNSVTNPSNWLITRDGAVISPSNIAVTEGYNPTTNRYEAVVNLPTVYTSGHFRLHVRDALRDVAGNAIDPDADGAPGGSLVLPFSVLSTFGARGNEFRVNSHTTDAQSNAEIAVAPAGNFVVAWTSQGQDGSGSGIYAQRFDARGAPQGGEFRVNEFTTSNQNGPAVAMDGAGNFVVAWQSVPQNGIMLRRFSATGVPLSGEYFANAAGGNLPGSASVAMQPSGAFVVAWEANDGSFAGVFARRFGTSGTSEGNEFRVNALTAGTQDTPSAAMDAEGNFVITWRGQNATGGSGFDVLARRYTATGGPLGSEFLVNSTTANDQFNGEVAVNAVGDFVIVWDSTDASGSDVYARRYGSGGVPQGGEFRVNTTTSNNQSASSVALDPEGRFVVVWHSILQDGSGYGIYAKRFAPSGAVQTDEFRVNSVTTLDQRDVSVAMDDDGDFVVAWDSYGQDGSRHGVHAQRYGSNRAPFVGLLADTPDPVAAGTPIMLSAGGVGDESGVASVAFYRESNGIAGLQVGFDGDALVGSAAAPSAGVWFFNASTVGLPPGTYTYWAQATDDTGLVGAPASTTNTVIPAAPAVTSSNFDFATLPQRLRFTFDQNVGPSLGLDDIVVQQLPGGPTVTPSGLSYDAGTNTATFAFNTAILDGRYRATLLAAGISGPGGNLPADHAFEFTFLRGDANGDGRVNLNDFNILAANFGQSPRDFTQGDFDYSGVVNLNDFNILASRFGVVVGPNAGDAARGSAVDEEVTDELDELLG